MQLDQIAIALRARTPWEALDLGHGMLRAWRRPVLRAWAGTYLPVGLVLFVLLWDSTDLAAAVLWWLKPLFDRVLLFVYGRAMFGAAPGLREVYRELPRLIRGTGLLAGLTVQRFSMARSFFLPVVQLEGLKGRAARNRRRVLGVRTSGYAVWLTLVLANMTAVLGFSMVLLADWLRPVDTASLFDWHLWFDGEAEPWMLFLLNAAFMIGDTVVEPLYVACGFGLYLNRRTELEAWDIELAFRRMAQRVEVPKGLASAGRAACVAAALAVVLFAAAPDSAYAAAVPGTAADRPAAAKQAIAEVLADPVFGRDVEGREWRYRSSEAEQDRDPPAWLARLERIVEAIAAALRWLVYGALAVALGAAIFLLYRQHERRIAARRVDELPQSLFGLDLRPGSLPNDVVTAARRELAAGRSVAALSLLYRGALVALIHHARVEFRAGDTEDDCERRVAGRVGDAAYAYFRDLLAAWRAAAYGHAGVEPERLDRLCLDWGRHFARDAVP